MKTRDQLLGEIRYAIRLCQRTARLYRRAQTTGIFLAIVGGSGTLAGLSGSLPGELKWLGPLGALLLTMAGAALIAIRPADKAAQNEADVRRYQAVMVKSGGLSDEALAQAVDEAHQGDAPEVEPLRNVAFNDVMLEINRADQMIPLSATEKLIRSLA